MRIRNTDIDEQLDRLENIENGEVFFCDKKTSRIVFHNKTVATLTQNTEIQHALLIFEARVSEKNIRRTATKIGTTLERLNRDIQIDIIGSVDRELFDMLQQEYAKDGYNGNDPSSLF